MNDDRMFCTKSKLFTWKTTRTFIVTNFLLVPTAVKLRNSKNYEICQLWYSQNYSNFFQVFVHAFAKPEKHISKNISKVPRSSYFYGVGKNVFAKCLCLSKMKVLLWHQCQVIHRYKNLRCTTLCLSLSLFLSIVISLSLYIIEIEIT